MVDRHGASRFSAFAGGVAVTGRSPWRRICGTRVARCPPVLMPLGLRSRPSLPDLASARFQTMAGSAGVQSQGARARCPSAQPATAPGLAADLAARMQSRLVVVRGTATGQRRRRRYCRATHGCCCGRRVSTHVARDWCERSSARIGRSSSCA